MAKFCFYNLVQDIRSQIRINIGIPKTEKIFDVELINTYIIYVI